MKLASDKMKLKSQKMERNDMVLNGHNNSNRSEVDRPHEEKEEGDNIKSYRKSSQMSEKGRNDMLLNGHNNSNRSEVMGLRQKRKKETDKTQRWSHNGLRDS